MTPEKTKDLFVSVLRKMCSTHLSTKRGQYVAVRQFPEVGSWSLVKSIFYLKGWDVGSLYILLESIYPTGKCIFYLKVLALL